MNKYGGTMEWNFTGENIYFLTEVFPMPLCPTQVSNVVIQETNNKTKARNKQLYSSPYKLERLAKFNCPQFITEGPLVSAGRKFNEQKLKCRWTIFYFDQFLLPSVNYRFYSSFSKRCTNQSAPLIRGTIQPMNILAGGVSWLNGRCLLPSPQCTL
jgi:hypothetical protein